MLRARVLVALFGVPLGVGVIILGSPYYSVALGVVALAALHEYYSLVRPYRPNLLVGYVIAAGALAATYFYGLPGMAGALSAGMFILFLWGVGGPIGDHLVGRMAVTAFGVMWIVTGLAHLLLIRGLEHGMSLTLLVVGATWTSDTGAYAVGRLMGRRPMAPRISPKKTVEGAVGGIVGAILFALAVKIYSPWLPVREALILGLAIGVLGQWGDLFESMVKRDLGRKDSGRMLPGHGGMLDRFDSLLFGSIAAYWGAVILLADVTLSGGTP